MNTVVERLENRVLLAADAVVHWNDITINVLKADNTLPGPTWASRTLAMVHGAIYDAVNGIAGVYEPYLVHARAPRFANVDAAVAAAAHGVLVALYPQQRAALDQEVAAVLDQIPNGVAEKQGVHYGQLVARTMIAERRNDGAGAPSPYEPTGEAGHWEPDPMNPGQSALAPEWGSLEPFSMIEGAQFRPPPPPEMTSAAYAAALEEVRLLGGDGSTTPTTRTAEQTEIGIFWGYDRAGMGAPPSMYNQIVQTVAELQDNTLLENARLFALVNFAQADAGIAAWDCKYVDDLWRPISGIRHADLDGNPDTTADPTWTPLGAPGGGVVPNFTPPFPAYVSGHATFGAATFKVLEQFYGTDQVNFTVSSDELPGVTRSFTSFSQAAAENGRSRIYLGIHWNFDDQEGQALGREIAGWVVDHVAGPRVHPPAGPLAAEGIFSTEPVKLARIIDSIVGADESPLIASLSNPAT